MNTPLSFTVTTEVTSCQMCPHNDEGTNCDIAPFKQWKKVFEENKDQLTTSCPMVAKEGEKK